MGTRFQLCCQRELPARVLSVHQRVKNIEAGDELLALALPQAGGSSRFLHLNVLPCLSRGDKVQLTSDFLKIATAQGDCVIALANVPLWQGPLPAVAQATLTEERFAQFEEAQHTLKIHPGVDAACAIEPKTVKRWIGLGPGLTPAGDDILLGYLAVDNHFGRDRAHTRALHKAVESKLGRTSALSAHLLMSAMQGDYHEYVQQVIAVLCGYSSENMLTALRRLRAVGATSGESMIYGMWLALTHMMNRIKRAAESGLSDGGELCTT